MGSGELIGGAKGPRGQKVSAGGYGNMLIKTAWLLLGTVILVLMTGFGESQKSHGTGPEYISDGQLKFQSVIGIGSI